MGVIESHTSVQHKAWKKSGSIEALGKVFKSKLYSDFDIVIENVRCVGQFEKYLGVHLWNNMRKCKATAFR